MNRLQVPGSKPRKFITRTILTNPSLISVSVTSILDPQNGSLPKIYNAIEKKQNLIAQNQNRIANGLSPTKISRRYSVQNQSKNDNKNGINQMDSLQQAENQFLNKKISQPQLKIDLPQRSPLIMKKQIGKQLSFMSRGSSTPSLYLNSFNYKNTAQIKQKQSKPYNIISNII